MAVFVFLATLKSHRTYIGGGDEPHYMVVAESLFLDFDVDVSNNYKSEWQVPVKDLRHSHVFPDGVERPFATVGLPLLGVPTYAFTWIAQKVGTPLGFFKERKQRWIFVKNSFSFSMMAAASFFAVFLWGVLTPLVNSSRFAWIMALIFTCSPPIMSFSLLFFTGLPLAFFILFLYSELINKRTLTLKAALVAGFMPWVHPRTGLISVLVVGLFGLLVLKDWMVRKDHKALISYGKMASIAALGCLGYWLSSSYLWRTFSPDGLYQYIHYKPFDAGFLPTAVPALFFDRSFGLFIMNPLYILFVGGLLIMFKHSKQNTLFLLSIVSVYLATVSGFLYWWGGWCPGARYLMPIMPLLVLPTAIFIKTLWDSGWRFVVRLLGSITVLFSLLYWQKPKLLWNFEHEAVNRFLVYWFGGIGTKIQEYWPNFMDDFPKPQYMALLFLVYILFMNGLLYIKTQEEKKS